MRILQNSECDCGCVGAITFHVCLFTNNTDLGGAKFHSKLGGFYGFQGGFHGVFTGFSRGFHGVRFSRTFVVICRISVITNNSYIISKSTISFTVEEHLALWFFHASPELPFPRLLRCWLGYEIGSSLGFDKV